MGKHYEETGCASRAAREAGRVVLRLAREGFETARKANQDPVTTADLEADAVLRNAIAAAFPADGWLSEETRDHPDRLSRRRVWIVYPLDGGIILIKTAGSGTDSKRNHPLGFNHLVVNAFENGCDFMIDRTDNHKQVRLPR